MIIPNLMVTDMRRSIAFYRDTLGLTVKFAITADQQMTEDTTRPGLVFAVLAHDGGELMLQTAASLANELPVFSADQTPTPGGTIYIRGLHPQTVLDRIPDGIRVRGPVKQWYGMVELYVKDPDGHIICLGAPEGPPPA